MEIYTSTEQAQKNGRLRYHFWRERSFETLDTETIKAKDQQTNPEIFTLNHYAHRTHRNTESHCIRIHFPTQDGETRNYRVVTSLVSCLFLHPPLPSSWLVWPSGVASFWFLLRAVSIFNITKTGGRQKFHLFAIELIFAPVFKRR
ncbi:hypothetical protein TNCV_2242081 [Trichonephila clavipes]|nr:hypothetical protein TNCV_2242081 [Trichonephila clavipes]